MIWRSTISTRATKRRNPRRRFHRLAFVIGLVSLFIGLAGVRDLGSGVIRWSRRDDEMAPPIRFRNVVYRTPEQRRAWAADEMTAGAQEGALGLVGLVIAIFLQRKHSRSRRILIGHCTNCEYNLTGNTSGVCPECGVVVSKDRVVA